MSYLVVQIAVFLLIATVLGVVVGWYSAKFIYNRVCDTSKQSLHLNQQDPMVLAENSTLRARIQQAEQLLQESLASRQTLERELVHLRKALAEAKSKSPNVVPMSMRANTELWALETDTQDDFTLIQGINQRIADTLHALGIIQYRQIAEFTADDVSNIRRIIAAEDALPLEQWVEKAQVLYQQQRQQLSTPLR